MLKGRVAVVTGGGRGIGFHTASRLAELGARVMIVDKGTPVATSTIGDSSVAAVAAEKLNQTGGTALHSEADVTDLKAMSEVIAQTDEVFGPVDILVNAAGIIRDRMVWNVPEEEWDDIHRVHLKGCFATTRGLARAVRGDNSRQSTVDVVNFASSAGVFGMAGSSAYGAAKAGVIGFSRITSMELAALGFRVNCVVPFAWTRMAAQLPSGTNDNDGRRDRLQRLKPEDVARLVSAICASTDPQLTGQVLGMRGRELLLFSPPSVQTRLILADTETDELSRLLDSSALRFVPPTPSTTIFNYEPF